MKDTPVDIAFHYVLQSYTGARSELEAVERRIESQMTVMITLTLFGALALMTILNRQPTLEFGYDERLWLIPTLVLFGGNIILGLLVRGRGEFRSVDPYKMMVQLRRFEGDRKEEVITLAGAHVLHNKNLINLKSKAADIMLFIFVSQVAFGIGTAIAVLS